jgi:hypothetical protein
MRQILVRLDDHTHATFKALCDHIPGGMQGVIASHVEVFIAHEHDRSIRHLDGSLCPVSALIDALATTTRAELESRSHAPPRTSQPPPP